MSGPGGIERRSRASRIIRALSHPRALAAVVAVTAIVGAGAITIGGLALRSEIHSVHRIGELERANRPSREELVRRILVALRTCASSDDCRRELKRVLVEATR